MHCALLSPQKNTSALKDNFNLFVRLRCANRTYKFRYAVVGRNKLRRMENNRYAKYSYYRALIIILLIACCAIHCALPSHEKNTLVL